MSMRAFIVLCLLCVAQVSLAQTPRADIECSLVEKCTDGICSEIEPKPVVVRYVRFSEGLAAWVYGAHDVLEGPTAEDGANSRFGVLIPGGEVLVLMKGQHGQVGDTVWFDLFSHSRDFQQRLFVDSEIVRMDDGKCVTNSKVHAGRPDQPPLEVMEGYRGQCRWSERLCAPTNTTDKDGG